MNQPLQLLGIVGSLRQKSYNAAALRAAAVLAPDDVRITLFDIGPIPLYNEDERERGFPAPVQELRNRIQAADALLIASPEYNYSIPGVLKNMIDWVSRPPEQPFDGKPIALFGASPGGLGGARCQYHLRQTFVYLNGMVLNQPEVMIAAAHTKFDQDGKLVDAETQVRLQQLVVALASWTRRLQAAT